MGKKLSAALSALVLSLLMWVMPIGAVDAQTSPPVATTGQVGPGQAVQGQATPQQAAPKSFLPPRASGQKAEAPPAPPSGVLAGLYFWIADKQRQFISTLAQSLRDIKSGNILAASLVLIGFSFAYGVLHAAGPGHGKAIVSSYILADGQTVRRGVQLAFLSAFVQAISAIVIFSVVVLALKGARSQIANTEAWVERASWAIVAAFGAWLLFRQLRALLTGASAHDHAHHGHGHHSHMHDHAAHGHANAHHDHEHHRDHGHDHKSGHDHHNHAPGEACDTCDHAHMPTAQALQGQWSWPRAAAMAFAIGIRPCTGAIGVLFVANGLGLIWAGVASTFAMAIGTAITVSALAALAATSRDAASKLASVADNSWASRAQTAFGLAGAALVFVLGATFFYYSLSTTTPF